jgi:hypothetical protein
VDVSGPFASSLVSRSSLHGVESLVDHFQAMYPRAKASQGALALVAAGSGVAAYLNTLDTNKNVLLGTALAMFAMWPYTLIALIPVNDQLMDGDG